jgi:hypothetical protein
MMMNSSSMIRSIWRTRTGKDLTNEPKFKLNSPRKEPIQFQGLLLPLPLLGSLLELPAENFSNRPFGVSLPHLRIGANYRRDRRGKGSGRRRPGIGRCMRRLGGWPRRRRRISRTTRMAKRRKRKKLTLCSSLPPLILVSSLVPCFGCWWAKRVVGSCWVRYSPSWQTKWSSNVCLTVRHPVRIGRYGTCSVCAPSRPTHIYPLAPPMKLTADRTAAETWLYPLNRPKRDYQFNIVQNCLFDNTLVALPTGLGKTFIAGCVMLNCTPLTTCTLLGTNYSPLSLSLVSVWQGHLRCAYKATCRSADRGLPQNLWNTWKRCCRVDR